MDLSDIVVMLAMGGLAGFVSALFGIGGGLVMVPLLVYGLNFGFAEATALSLLAMTFQVPSGVYQHAKRRVVDWRLGALLAVGGALGVVFARFLDIKVEYLKLLFAIVMVLAAWRMLVKPPQPRLTGQHPTLATGLGFVAGAASKLLGIGGGLVTVPVLTLMGTPIHNAVATSLVAVFSNALLASMFNLANPGLHADWLLVIPLASAGLVTSYWGTKSAHGLAAPNLKRAFAAVLVLGAIYVGATSGAWRL